MTSRAPEFGPNQFFRAWRTMSLEGSRDVMDGVLLPEHRGPSADLAAFLATWPGAWYWGDDERSRLVLIRGSAIPRPERWLWHGALLVLTIICTLAGGAMLEGRMGAVAPRNVLDMVTGVVGFAQFIATEGWRVLHFGWEFAVPLLGILLIHELGHYFVARRYAIDVSPPYFLPVPPNISPIGNLGAFIRIRSPVYDRRQLLDVGAAGPLAGFVAAFGVLVWGYFISHRVGQGIAGAPSMVLLQGRPVLLGDSLLTHALREWILPGDGPVLLSAPAFAGWVGMFITGLNLLPLSQLDGGHVTYGVLGRQQKYVGLAGAIGLLLLAPRAPMWYLWVALTFAIGGGGWGHQDVVIPGRPVLRWGRGVGIACLVVFVLTFVPIPFLR